MSKLDEIDSPSFLSTETYRLFVQALLEAAQTASARGDFLKSATLEVLSKTRANWVELRIRQQGHFSQCDAHSNTQESSLVRNKRCIAASDGAHLTVCKEDPSIYYDVAIGHYDPTLTGFTKKGSAWSRRPENANCAFASPEFLTRLLQGRKGELFASSVLLPLSNKNTRVGLLRIAWKDRIRLSLSSVEALEDWADTLIRVFFQRMSVVALNERVKELTCLYGIARIFEQRDLPTDQMLFRIVEMLPPAWQYPEVATARIIYDNNSFVSTGFQEGQAHQVADIIVAGQLRGLVEVFYAEERPMMDEGPFLREERSLISTVARQLGFVLEEREIRSDRTTLHDQLLHADRLATIGQLGAGVAHELNEPIGSILGFAQLLQKTEGLPRQAVNDIDRIVKASLHAREVVKKLLIFGRKVPFQKSLTDINTVIEDALFFLESRCTKEGINVERLLESDLPLLQADAAQLRQVVVNLVVNAMHAMQKGGALTIQTKRSGQTVLLIVKDTGAGMNEDALRSIFVPFYTTKALHEGTGLGLPVVHGIVTSHGGTIRVDSRPGQGARFEIAFPVSAENTE